MALSEACAFFDGDLAPCAFQVFENMKESKELCDITIKVQNGSFVAHRVVLAATIPYFKLMFNSKMLEATLGEITLLDLDPKAVELIIGFAYSGRIRLTTENAFSLLLVSDYFQLNKVKEYCGEFLSLQLSNSNVVRIHDLALSISHAKLIESTDHYIQDNFQEFSRTREFKDLPYAFLEKFISRDSLNVTGEYVIFEAIMRWTKASPRKRLEFLPKLLSEVRMPFLSEHYLKEFVLTEKLINESYHSRFIISEAVKFFSSPEENSVFLPFRAMPRNYSIKKHGIYVMLASGLSDCNYSVTQYDPHCRTWSFFESFMVCEGTICQIVIVKEEIFVFLEDHRYYKFNLRSKTWEKSLRPINGHKFCRSAIVPHHNKVYCFGGQSSFSDFIFCFSAEQKSWTSKGKMTTARSFPAATGLGGSIYVTGGLDSLTVHRSAERYCVLTGYVTEVSPMLSRRRNHGSASVNSKIYVCGGYCDGALRTAEVYDPQLDQWTSISVMPKATMNFSLVSHQQKLYIFGCMLHRDSTDIQIYDTEKNEWTLDKAPANVASAAAVPGN